MSHTPPPAGVVRAVAHRPRLHLRRQLFLSVQSGKRRKGVDGQFPELPAHIRQPAPRHAHAAGPLPQRHDGGTESRKHAENPDTPARIRLLVGHRALHRGVRRLRPAAGPLPAHPSQDPRTAQTHDLRTSVPRNTLPVADQHVHEPDDRPCASADAHQRPLPADTGPPHDGRTRAPMGRTHPGERLQDQRSGLPDPLPDRGSRPRTRRQDRMGGRFAAGGEHLPDIPRPGRNGRSRIPGHHRTEHAVPERPPSADDDHQPDDHQRFRPERPVPSRERIASCRAAGRPASAGGLHTRPQTRPGAAVPDLRPASFPRLSRQRPPCPSHQERHGTGDLPQPRRQTARRVRHRRRRSVARGIAAAAADHAGHAGKCPGTVGNTPFAGRSGSRRNAASRPAAFDAAHQRGPRHGDVHRIAVQRGVRCPRLPRQQFAGRGFVAHRAVQPDPA